MSGETAGLSEGGVGQVGGRRRLAAQGRSSLRLQVEQKGLPGWEDGGGAATEQGQRGLREQTSLILIPAPLLTVSVTWTFTPPVSSSANEVFSLPGLLRRLKEPMGRKLSLEVDPPKAPCGLSPTTQEPGRCFLGELPAEPA